MQSFPPKTGWRDDSWSTTGCPNPKQERPHACSVFELSLETIADTLHPSTTIKSCSARCDMQQSIGNHVCMLSQRRLTKEDTRYMYVCLRSIPVAYSGAY